MLGSTHAVLRAALLHDASKNSEARLPGDAAAVALGSTVDDTNPATAGIAQVITMLPCCVRTALPDEKRALCSPLQNTMSKAESASKTSSNTQNFFTATAYSVEDRKLRLQLGDLNTTDSVSE